MSDKMIFATSSDDATDSNNEFDKRSSTTPWKILIVDDEPEIHNITRIILKKEQFEGRKFELISAYSGQEALEILEQDRNNKNEIAIILLDVVMESSTAGLDAATHIRKNMDNKIVRIILRTGQPGNAPDKSVMVDYDINDYKEKSELTANKLFISVIAALRSYNQLNALDTCRRKLTNIFSTFPGNCKYQTLNEFSNILLDRIDNVLEFGNNSFYLQYKDNQFNIISSNGEFETFTEESLLHSQHKQLIDQAINRQATQIETSSGAFYFKSPDLGENLVFIHSDNNIKSLDFDLLNTYINNSLSAYSNLLATKNEMSA